MCEYIRIPRRDGRCGRIEEVRGRRNENFFYRLLRVGCTVSCVGVPAPPGVTPSIPRYVFFWVYRVGLSTLIDAPVNRQPSSQRFRRRGDWTFRS